MLLPPPDVLSQPSPAIFSTGLPSNATSSGKPLCVGTPRHRAHSVGPFPLAQCSPIDDPVRMKTSLFVPTRTVTTGGVGHRHLAHVTEELNSSFCFTVVSSKLNFSSHMGQDYHLGWPSFGVFVSRWNSTPSLLWDLPVSVSVTDPMLHQGRPVVGPSPLCP